MVACEECASPRISASRIIFPGHSPAPANRHNPSTSAIKSLTDLPCIHPPPTLYSSIARLANLQVHWQFCRANGSNPQPGTICIEVHRCSESASNAALMAENNIQAPQSAADSNGLSQKLRALLAAWIRVNHCTFSCAGNRESDFNDGTGPRCRSAPRSTRAFP